MAEQTNSTCLSLASSLGKVAASDADRLSMRNSAMADVRNVLLAGLGVGAGARGLYGLYNLLNRSNRGPEPTSPAGPLPTEMPVDEEEDKLKLAGDGDKPSWWSTGSGESKTGIPWYLLAGVGAGAGGTYGGWKIMDMILDKRRLQAQEDDLEEARTDFRSALSPDRVKASSDDPSLGQDLDKLYDLLQKQAADGEKQALFGDMSGKALGMYGLYGGVSGLAAGLWMYNIAKKRQRRALLDKAKKERERKRFERQPPPIEAFPSLPAPA